MPTYTVAGVPVDFPYEAYEVQLAYMEKVVLALSRGQNALLESPTGTGKTLSLLCAALGWRRAMVESARPADPSGSGAPAADDLGQALKASLGQGSGLGQLKGRLPRIIYASRTHSQLQQVVRELRRTVHRPTVCVLGSREQLCVHPHVKTLTGAAQGGACQALTAALGCGFHTKLQLLKRKQGGMLEHPEKQLDESERTLPDIEDFVSLSSQKELCPFYYARELQREAEMLFVPYNYLIDPSARRALNIELAEDVIIFDEAHNMERACTDAASVDLSAAQLVGCVKEVDRCIQGAQNSEAAALDQQATLSPYVSLHLPTSPYISLHLPTSPYISLNLPTSPARPAGRPRRARGGRVAGHEADAPRTGGGHPL